MHQGVSFQLGPGIASYIEISSVVIKGDSPSGRMKQRTAKSRQKPPSTSCETSATLLLVLRGLSNVSRLPVPGCLVAY